MEITVPDGMLMNEALIEQLTTQMLDAFARKAHTHSQSDITGLETALAGFLQESDLDNVLKIQPGNWGYTKETLIYENSFGMTTEYYKYQFNQIEPGCVAVFDGEILLEYHNVSCSDYVCLPDGGLYLYGGIYTKDFSQGSRVDITTVIRTGGGLFLAANNETTHLYLHYLYAIRLS